VVVLLVCAWPLLAVAAHTGDTWHDLLLQILAVLGYATFGALITSRKPGNAIGLILLWIGLASAAGLVAGTYAKWGIDGRAPLPLVTGAAWLGRTLFPTVIGAIPLLFLLFPTGKVPSARWRPVLWVMVGALTTNVLLIALTPGSMVSGFTELNRPLANPVGLPMSWQGAIFAVTIAAGLVVLACSVLSIVSLVLRFRRATGDERQQIRWLAYVGALAISVSLLGILIGLIRIVIGIQATADDPVGNAVFLVLIFLVIFGVPAACGIAILRYHLWELDVVLRKTALYVVLAGLLLVVGLAFVWVGRSVLVLVLPEQAAEFVGAVVIGLLVWPLRGLATRIADRVVYGGRATPYEVLTAFAERAGGSYATEDVLPRMAQVLAQGVGASRARVWLRVGAELRPAAVWPTTTNEARAPVPLVGDVLPEFAHERTVEVRDGGELLGALSIEMPASDPMTPAKEHLVGDLASQAGLVLRNVRLIEELRASRQRLVAAQDAERRRIERNIHDGVQQQLVALAVKLKLADALIERDAAKAHEALAALQSDTGTALEDLRDLARGIYPPLLADQGLVAALEAQARKAAVPTVVEADGVIRYPPEVEATVYFCTLEALNNVAKYANASRARVHLVQTDGHLAFTVLDDGVGFDTAAMSYGTGLRGMADRLDAIGGQLSVTSAPGIGTTLQGRLPIGWQV
jgi:signal transduction histidine kinase